MNLHRIVGLIALMGGLLCATHAACEVTLHVQAGIGDNVRSGAIVPVRVHIINDTENDYQGRLSISFRPVMGGRPLAWYHRSVPMPPGAEKVVYFYAPLASTANAVLTRYETASGREVAESEGRIRDFGRDRPVMLAVSESPHGLPDAKVDGDDVYYRLGCLPADVPRDALGLTMFDAIVISPPPPTPMRADQLTALRDWVLSGGTLILDASRRTDFLQDPAVAALTPFTPTQQEQAALPLFDAEANFSRGQQNGGEVIFGDEETPLVIRKPYGLGSITAIAIAPDSPALKRWDGVHDLWNDLLQPAGIGIDPKRFKDASPRQYDNEAQMAMQETVKSGPRSAVRLGIVVLLTALYAIAVGPGDYFLVRRLGKPKLTWITFPIIVAVFTAVAYFGARIYVGGDLAQLYNERIRIYADEGVTSKYEIGSVFVPVGRRYVVDVEDSEHMALPLRTDATPGDPVIDVDLDTGAITQHIPIWTQRYYERRINTAESPAITFELHEEDDKAIAIITNNSPHDLTNIAVAYKRGIHKVAETTVLAGEEARIELGDVERLHVDQSRASWPREITVLRNALSQHMSFALVNPATPLVNQRDSLLRQALEQGAAVLIANAPAPTKAFRINGESIAPEGASYIQVITYDGVKL